MQTDRKAHKNTSEIYLCAKINYNEFVMQGKITWKSIYLFCSAQ